MSNRLALSAAFLALLIMPQLVSRASAAQPAEEKPFDKRFVKDASQYSIVEDDICRLPRDHSGSDGVKHFGELVLGGQKKLIDELGVIAKGHDYKLSDEFTAKQKDTMQRLRKLEGTNFDVEFMSNEVQDQQAFVELFEDASKKCKDKNLCEFADRKLPMLREHQQNAVELYKKVKNKER